MKKQSLLLITGGILAFASCNTDTGNTADENQAKIDSMVNERVDEIRMELQMKNDSIINDLAMYRADSMIAAAKGRRVVRKRPTPKPNANMIAPGKKDNAMNGGGSSNSGGIKSKSDANKKSGTDKFKSKSDANKKSGANKFKSKAD